MTAPKVATERLFFNEDKTQLVPEGHPDARFLAAGVGDEIPDTPKALKAPVEDEADDTDAAAKQAAKAADKSVKAADNK